MALSAHPGQAPGGVVGTLLLPQSLSLKLTTIDLIGGIKCPLCHTTFGNKKDYDSHYVNHNTGSPTIVYMCVVCHKEITGYPSFRNHCYSIHVVKDRFKCLDCSKQFSKSSILQQHIDTVHKFVCVQCKKQFSSKKEMQIHKITHKSDSPPFDCQTCGQQIDTADSCEQHIDDHCTLTYSCPICSEIIPDKAKAADHLITHFGNFTNEEEIPESDVEITLDSSIDLIGGILCCFCDTTHKNRIELDLHFAENHVGSEIIYSCNICRKQYTKYPQFGDHCYYHYAKGRFECDECDKSFPRLSLLVLHTEGYHSGPAAAKPFACAYCSNAYASEKRLSCHMRDAHGVQAVSCNEHGCGQTFDTPKDLIYHQAVHKSGNRCQHCLLQFTSLATCERHIPMHCKKQYSCPVCTRSYAEKYLVMKHISQHFSTVLHLCNLCGKVFNAKHRLVEHLKTHSEVRNFKCTYCDKGFVKPHHLKQHLNIHTGLKPYQCSLCPKTFASYPNYHKHMRRMHNALKVPVKPSFEVETRNEIDTNARKKENAASNNNNVMEEDLVNSTSSELETNTFMDESDDSLDVLKVPVKSPFEVETRNEIKKENEAARNNNTVIDEDFIDSTSSELESYAFIEESDDSLVEPKGIDPVAMEHESKLFEAAASDYTNLDVPEFTELLPEHNHNSFVAAVTPSFAPAAPQAVDPGAWPPQEYGPDFGKDVAGFVDLDEQLLPHIDPLLTIKSQPDMFEFGEFGDYTFPGYEPPEDPGFVKWEPLIARVLAPCARDHDARRAVLNTDIY